MSSTAAWIRYAARSCSTVLDSRGKHVRCIQGRRPPQKPGGAARPTADAAAADGVRASSRKRVAEPWDLLRGKDVFRDESKLKISLRDAKVAHWAPNCCTFKGKREAYPGSCQRQNHSEVWSPLEVSQKSYLTSTSQKEETRP